MYLGQNDISIQKGENDDRSALWRLKVELFRGQETSPVRLFFISDFNLQFKCVYLG